MYLVYRRTNFLHRRNVRLPCKPHSLEPSKRNPLCLHNHNNMRCSCTYCSRRLPVLPAQRREPAPLRQLRLSAEGASPPPVVTFAWYTSKKSCLKHVGKSRDLRIPLFLPPQP